MSDPTKIFASFRARQLTMTGIGRHLERPEAEILKRDFPDAVVAIGPRATWDNFVMNVTKPPFNDLRVRKAVALATDREKMIEIAVEGWGLLGGAPYIVIASASLGGAILVEASLSFLGMGVPPPASSWGRMLSLEGMRFFETAVWMAIFPGVFISGAVFGANLFGDALRDVLDPKLRGR
jgi:ABC-type transport system substrate-binding protein